MTLAEAFMKRNDLKKEIEELTVHATNYLWQDKETPVDFGDDFKLMPNEALQKALARMDDLTRLNIAIDRANDANRELLQKLRTLSVKISLYESIVRAAKNFPGKKVRDTSLMADGQKFPRFIEYEWNIDPVKIQKDLVELKTQKRNLERLLQKNNYSIEVEE